ncbi:MAG: DUF1028 domain-containing protein [Bacillota bacterium]
MRTDQDKIVATFSIVACDLEAREWGVAVQSKFMAVGAVVPWARAEVGAVATQARTNTTFGPRGLEMMEQGLSAQETLDRLLASDPDLTGRQVAMVDRKGGAAAYTSPSATYWAGHVTGNGYSCQGNILTGPEVVEGMAKAFEGTKGDLAERLVAALEGGQGAGGDSRGRQSAALLVVKDKGGYNGLTDRYIDLRVEDHLYPINELRRILELYRFFFLKDKPESLPYSGTILLDLQGRLRRLGYYGGALDGQTDVNTALTSFAANEGLAELLRDDRRISTQLILKLYERAAKA